MPRIFISYRRDDTQGVAGRIYDRLVEAFGKENIFIDVDNIPPGGDFRQVLREAIQRADVVLPLIGSRWENLMRKRRNAQNDFVRFELLEAAEQNKITVPVLLNTLMPDNSCLPNRLRPVFPYLNAVAVDMGANFHRDMTRLITQLQTWQDFPPPPRIPPVPIRPQWVDRLLRYFALAAAVLLGALLGVGGYTGYARLTSDVEIIQPTPLFEGAPTATDMEAYIRSHDYPPPEPIIAAVTGGRLAVRPVRDSNAPYIDILEDGTPLMIEGRSWDGLWLSTIMDGQRVWIRVGFINMRRSGEPISVVDVPLDGSDMGTALEVLMVYDYASRFYDALIAAGLDELLNGEATITLFVPPNTAFDALLVEQGITLRDTDTLHNLLQAYILMGDFSTTRIIHETTTAQNGETVQISYAPDGQLQANTVPIVLPDITVSNGTLHILSDVFSESAP
jgi:hypothetical protein